MGNGQFLQCGLLLTSLITCFILLYTESKKQDTKLWPITSQMLTDFQNSYDLSLITIHISDCRQFSDIHISQGSVATYLRCGGIFKHEFVTNLPVGLSERSKPIWILLKQETVSGSGISWAICKSAPSSRQITTPVPHHLACKKLSGGVLTVVLPFWYRLTRVVLEKGPLNGCTCVCVLLVGLSVKEFWKSLNICGSYGQEFNVLFFLTDGVHLCF